MNKKDKKLIGHQGFSLVEILVALALVAVVFTIVPFPTNDDKSKLEDAVADLERAVKYASAEAVLRNTVTRILIDNDFEEDDEVDDDKKVIKYSVQFGPSSGALLPPAQDISKISLSDLEEYQKKQKKFHSKFNPIEEYANKQLPEGVSFEGLATSYQREIQQEGKLAIYFYPTGEKDDALLILSARTEIASLEILAFKERTKWDYIPISELELENRDGFLDNKIKELHDKWIKQ